MHPCRVRACSDGSGDRLDHNATGWMSNLKSSSLWSMNRPGQAPQVSPPQCEPQRRRSRSANLLETGSLCRSQNLA